MTKYNNYLKFASFLITASILPLITSTEPLNASDNIQSTSSALNWYELWDSSSVEATRNFANVNDSRVDVTVEYSTNQKWQHLENHNGLNLYDNYSPKKDALNHDHSLWIYHGILRMTNNPQDTGENAAWVKVTFSQPVTIEQLWAGSLSTINSRREWMKVSAYSSSDIDMNNLNLAASNLVSPSKVDDYQGFFDTTCSQVAFTDNLEGHQCNLAGADHPDYIGILPNEDGSVLLKGLGSQGSKQYGRAFFEFNTPVRTIVFQHFATDIDNDAQRNSGYTSAAISPELVFTSLFAD